jgi:hypothetical protein
MKRGVFATHLITEQALNKYLQDLGIQIRTSLRSFFFVVRACVQVTMSESESQLDGRRITEAEVPHAPSFSARWNWSLQ